MTCTAAVLRALFAPHDVRAASAALGDLEPAPLWPEEQRAIAAAMPARRRAFAAGRTVARRALAELGIEPCALPVQADGRPRWPSGVTGTISHSDTLVVAVVAAGSGALGVDVVDRDHRPLAALDAIASAAERAWVRGAAEDAATRAALLLAAKECAWKCSPATDPAPERLAVACDLAAGTFTVATMGGGAVHGRFALLPHHVVAGAAAVWPPDP